MSMGPAQLFTSGRSQAVRLPEAYRFSGTTVLVKHFGGAVLLLPADKPCNLVSQAGGHWGQVSLLSFRPLMSKETGAT